MTDIHIRLDKFLKGQTIVGDSGVVTNIYPISAGASAKDGRRGLLVPITTEEDVYLKVSLKPGSYLIESVLPSGEIVSQEIQLEDNQPQEVVLECTSSPHEWLSWQQLSGNVERIRTAVATPRATSKGKQPPSKSTKGGAKSAPGTKSILSGLPGRFGDNLTEALEKCGAESSAWEYYVSSSPDGETESVSEDEIEASLSSIDDLWNQGIAEIAPGQFRADRFTGSLQWATFGALIGKGSERNLGELAGIGTEAFDCWEADCGLRWIDGEEEDQMTQVFHLLPNDRGEHDEIRDFLNWTPAGAELVRIPGEWKNIHDHAPRPIDLMVDLSPESKRFRSSVAVQDPSLAIAMGYLTSGSLPQAGAILGRAQDMLYGKISNPYAAAAGGYLLLNPGSEGDGQPKNWVRWIENLSNWYDWLPDGALLHGWVRLMDGDLAGAAELFRTAYERGVPLYSAGVKRLVDGVSLIAAEDESFKAMEGSVRRVAWRTNMDQLFTIIRLGPV